MSTLNNFGTDQPSLGGGITYFSKEHLIAATRRTVGSVIQGISLYDKSGVPAGSFSIYGQFRSPITYIAPTDQVAARSLNGTGIRVLNAQTGTDVRYIDLSGLGITNLIGLAYFNPQHPSGGEFLAFDADTGTAYIVDFNGNLVSTFEIVTKLGIHGPSAVTAMPILNFCGLFATVDQNRNEIVEFTMPCE